MTVYVALLLFFYLQTYRKFSKPENIKADLKRVVGIYGFFNLKWYKLYRFQFKSLWNIYKLC